MHVLLSIGICIMNSISAQTFSPQLQFPRTLNAIFPRFKGNQDGDYSTIINPAKTAAGLTHASNDSYDRYEGRPTADPFVLDAIQKYVPPGSTIVELGCHTGNNLEEVDDTRNPAIGIELSAAAVQKAQDRIIKKKKQNTDVVQWDFAEDGTLPPQYDHLKGKIGAIFAVQVLPHLTDDCLITTMQKLKDYLAPGGVIIITNLVDAPWKHNRLNAQLMGGGLPHSEAVIRQAFQGMKKIDGRTFQHHEPAFSWYRRYPSLEDKIQWYVFRKEQ
jgi:SAM-dependent methyltransferase